MIKVFILVPSLQFVSPINAALALSRGLSLYNKVTLVSFKKINVDQVMLVKKNLW